MEFHQRILAGLHKCCIIFIINIIIIIIKRREVFYESFRLSDPLFSSPHPVLNDHSKITSTALT